MMAGFIIPNKGTIKCQFNSSYEWLQNHIYIGSQNSLSNELSVLENIKAFHANGYKLIFVKKAAEYPMMSQNIQ